MTCEPSAARAGEFPLEFVEQDALDFDERAHRARLLANLSDRRHDTRAITPITRELPDGLFETSGATLLGLGLGQQVGGYREKRVRRIVLERHQVKAQASGKKIPSALT